MADDKVVKVGYHMDMRGRSIHTLADGVAPGDAVNVGQLQEAIDSIEIPPGGGPGAGYTLQDYEKTGDHVYVGYELAAGDWFIYRRTVATNVRQYARGSSSYPAAWTGRGGLAYA